MAPVHQAFLHLEVCFPSFPICDFAMKALHRANWLVYINLVPTRTQPKAMEDGFIATCWNLDADECGEGMILL